VANDDCLHATDSVRADNFSVRYHCKLAVRLRRPAEAPAKALRRSRAARTQHHQHASSALHSVESRGERSSIVTDHDEIDTSRHRVPLATTRTNGAGRRMAEDSVHCELVIASLLRSCRGDRRTDVFEDSDVHLGED
jgi:hypothetical protein